MCNLSLRVQVLSLGLWLLPFTEEPRGTSALELGVLTTIFAEYANRRPRIQFFMDRTLRDHISHLELLIRGLRDELEQGHRMDAERNCIQAEIRVAELALTRYRAALKLEGELRPTTRSTTKPSDY